MLWVFPRKPVSWAKFDLGEMNDIRLCGWTEVCREV
jgi:hypothetical protein